MSIMPGAALLLVILLPCSGWQQELTGADRRPPIAGQLKQAPLSATQRDEVSKAIAARDYKSAEKVLVQAINAEPTSAGLLTFAASIFLLDKDAMNAAIALKKAEKIRPLAEADRFSLVIAYIGIGKGDWARPELARLMEANPQNSLYAYWLARIDYDERKYDAAIERLRTVTKSAPAFMKAWDNLGLSLEGAGQLDEAAASYEKAVQLNRERKSSSAWPLINFGTLLTRMGQLKRGEELLREGAGIEPGLSEAHYRLGLNFHKQAQNEAAIVELRKTSDLDPLDPRPLYALSQIYRDQGDAKAASEALERFKALKKNKRSE